MSSRACFRLRAWWRTWASLSLVAFAYTLPLLAQENAPQPAQPITTLHVYTDLIQLPVLVLNQNRTPLKRLSPKGFVLSLDSGPSFKPVHVRREGDDPIQLSIILDVAAIKGDLLPKLDSAIAALAPLSLHPQDHVAIYSLDCSLIQAGGNPSTESRQLKVAVDAVLQSWNARGRDKHGPGCPQTVHLWDALTFAAQRLYSLPGRRVILVISDGRDRGSTHTWNELRSFAQNTAVTIFGLTNVPDVPGYSRLLAEHDPFNSVCELSGGMVFKASPNDVAAKLKEFVETVRGRYIIEFRRASNATAGQHNIDVAVDGTNDFVRPAGIAVPVPDAALLRDTTTVPSDPSLAPVMGTRRILAPPPR